MTGSRAEATVTWGLSAVLGLGILLALGDVVVGGLLDTWRSTGRSVLLAHTAVVTAAGAAWLGATVALGPMARSSQDLAWRPGPPQVRPFVVRYSGWSVPAAATTAATLVVVPLGAGTVGLALGVVATAGLLTVSVLAWLGQLTSARPALVGAAQAGGLGALGVLCLSTDETALGALVVLGAGGYLLLGVRRTRPTRPEAAPPRWSLRRAAEQRWALTASLVLLDGSIVRQSRERSASRRTVRPRARRAPRPALTRVLVLLTRLAPRVAVSCTVVGVLAHVVAPWSSATAACSVALFMAACTPTLAVHTDHWADAPALRRTFAATPSAVVLLAPATALALVGLAGIAGAGPSPLHGVLLVALAPALVLRRLHGRRAATDVLIATPFGPVMVSQVERALAGWDVTLVVIVLISLT